MDREDLGPILAKVYVAIRQNMEANMELALSVQATILALEEQFPGFQAVYGKHFQGLRRGEPGERNAGALRQFDQVVDLIRKGLL